MQVEDEAGETADMSTSRRMIDTLYETLKSLRTDKDRSEVMILESQHPDHPESNKSYVAAFPEQVIKAEGETITWFQGDSKVSEKHRKHTWQMVDAFFDETGWAFGYFGYEPSGPDHPGQRTFYRAPDLWFMVPEMLFLVDKNGVEQLKGPPLKIHGNTSSNRSCNVGKLSAEISQEHYLSTIEKIRHLIAEGDFYELNFSYPLEAGFEGSPFELYRSMREVNPVPFACYAEFPDLSICCASPERFLKKEGDRLFSEPIKGTAARGASPLEDEQFRQELKSEKNEAENLMIVDLVRHDLSRVCRPGTVTVSKLFEIQTFGTVHQLISRVEGELRRDTRTGEIIRACFPMGSMTGAPKHRVLKRISELENYKRGIYSGSIGYVTPENDFDFNVVIRSAIIQDGKLTYPVGGAITGDSIAADEWEETRVKAGLLRAVQNLQNVK